MQPDQQPPTSTPPPAPEAPTPTPAGTATPPPSPAPAGPSGNMKKWLMWGGIAVVVLIVLYVLFM